MRRLLLSGLFATLLIVLAPVLDDFIASAQTVDEQAREIEKQLQCPICNGSTGADSPSDLAGQMRAVVRQKVEAGESRDAIIQYFVDRYGDSILMEPPRRGIGLAVWLGPVIILAVGALILLTVLRGWVHPRRSPAPISVTIEPVHRNGTAHAEDTGHVSTLDRVQSELDQYRREA
jgi:cytochrome c-type biogenesis protein CcmH